MLNFGDHSQIEADDFDDHVERLFHSRRFTTAARAAADDPNSDDARSAEELAALVEFDRDQVTASAEIDLHEGLDELHDREDR